FGTRLDDTVRARLARGASVRAALRQAERDPMPALEQVAVLVAAMEGLFDGIAEGRIIDAMRRVRRAARDTLEDVAQRIESNLALGKAEQERIVDVARAALDAGSEGAARQRAAGRG
ncbi:MAG: hypothetical protein AB7S42_11470, partial [Lysobacteraceae bacterium]